MATVFDVAKYILEKTGEITSMKLQKLVYYSQAWSLVWDEEPIFSEKIEAWSNGPVVRLLYEAHRGAFKVNAAALTAGDISALTPKQIETIDAVFSYYGDKPAQWLSDLTHMEDPWINARERAGLSNGDRGWTEITIADMYEYYSGLLPNDEQQQG